MKKLFKYLTLILVVLSLCACGEKKEETTKKEKELIEKVRKYYKDLIRSPIPISRKIIMTIMYINYPMTKKIVRFYLYKIRKTKFTVK